MSRIMTSVKVIGRRTGTPGIFKVSVQGVDGSQLPNGIEIATGSVDANAWTTDFAGEIWYEITLDSSVVITDEIMYALVFTTPDAPVGPSHQVMLRSHNIDGAYARGHFCDWARGGSSWNKDTAKDFLFEALDTSGRFEYYDTGGTTWNGLFADGRYAQTFTSIFVFAPPITGSNTDRIKRLVVAANNKIFYEAI